MFRNVSFDMFMFILDLVSGLGFLGDPPDNGITWVVCTWFVRWNYWSSFFSSFGLSNGCN